MPSTFKDGSVAWHWTYPISAMASGETGIPLVALENFSAGIEALRLNSTGDAEDEADDTFRCLLTFFFLPMLEDWVKALILVFRML